MAHFSKAHYGFHELFVWGKDSLSLIYFPIFSFRLFDDIRGMKTGLILMEKLKKTAGEPIFPLLLLME